MNMCLKYLFGKVATILTVMLVFSVILCLPLSAQVQFETLLTFCDATTQKWGVKTQDGKIIVSAKYDAIYIQGTAIAIVVSDMKRGAIDVAGNVIIPIKYEELNVFSDALNARLDGKWGVVSRGGEEIVPLIYDDELLFMKETTSAKRDGKWGVVDKKGREIVPCKYDERISFGGRADNPDLIMAVVGIDGKRGIIDQNGVELIPCKYTRIVHGSEGLFAELDDKWGLFNDFLEIIVPFQYRTLLEVKGAAYNR